MSKAFRIVIEQDVKSPDTYHFGLFVRGEGKTCAAKKHVWGNKTFSVGQETEMMQYVKSVLKEIAEKNKDDVEVQVD
jgi:hypothetical protein